MEGLDARRSLAGAIEHADPEMRADIFGYFDHDKQVAIIETQDREEIADLISRLAPDDRVDRLSDVTIPRSSRKFCRWCRPTTAATFCACRRFPEGTAGAKMTTDFAKLRGGLTVGEALAELQHQAEGLETIYYLYIVDDEDHLRGVVSTRQLVSSMGRPNTPLAELMEADVVSVDASEDQEEVANRVARYDLLAIPVVDHEHHILGIITHDDAVDVFREEATEDAHMLAGVNPLEVGYLRTKLWTLCWKRGLWLTILFFGALFTAFALRSYEEPLARGNLAHRVHSADHFLRRQYRLAGGHAHDHRAHSGRRKTGRLAARRCCAKLLMGVFLGGFLGVCGMGVALWIAPEAWQSTGNLLVLPVTVLLVVMFGTLTGAILPLLFRRIGLDPALMSNPFVAGIVDIAGILIYMNVALLMLFARKVYRALARKLGPLRYRAPRRPGTFAAPGSAP